MQGARPPGCCISGYVDRRSCMQGARPGPNDAFL